MENPDWNVSMFDIHISRLDILSWTMSLPTLCFKADTYCEVRVHLLHSQDQHGRFFSRHCKWHYRSLADLNRHPSQVLDKHAPVCQRKVRQRRPRPWTYEYVGPWPRPSYSSFADQLRELKRERLRAERGWRSSLDRVWLFIYSCMTAKQKVADLVHGAKTSFCPSNCPSVQPWCLLVRNAKSCFTTWLLSLANLTNPLFLLFMISNNLYASSVAFFRNKFLSNQNILSPVAQKNNDCQPTFSAYLFLSFTPISEQCV